MGDTLISIIAIVTPFLFVMWIISTATKGKQRRQRSFKEPEDVQSDRELEKEIMALSKRIENLEIILRNRQNNKE